MSIHCSRSRPLLQLLALSLLTAGLANATVIEYSNPAQFVAALGAHSAVETFDGLPNLDVNSDAGYLGPVSFSPGVFSFSATVLPNSADAGYLYSSDIGGGDIALSTFNQNNPIVLTFAGGNVFAVGGYFWNTDWDYSPLSGAIELTLNGGDPVTFDTDGPAFYGFISDVPITSLTVAPAEGMFATINNIYLDDAPVTGTPEPGTLFAAVAGLAALALVRQRRRVLP